MLKLLPLLFLALFTMAPALAADPARGALPPAPQKSPSMADAERALALAEGGDAAAGKEVYAVCSACHLPSGFGRRDGGYPKLAGQHSTVLIKQIADIRAHVRENPGMHSFVMELRDPRDIANVAAHIESLCIPPGNGRYFLPDADARIVEGKQIFDKDCADCHQAKGQGSKEKGHPVLAGQHYRYLLRQMADIRDGYRQNVDPDMVSAVKKHKNNKLESLAAYLATLEAPGTPCEPAQARK
ncbi:MAG: c-type cytochrome [Rhodocyclales bacterium]|nr:c-type cytochrome [Rhodocyclales bacterium]